MLVLYIVVPYVNVLYKMLLCTFMVCYYAQYGMLLCTYVVCRYAQMLLCTCMECCYAP